MPMTRVQGRWRATLPATSDLPAVQVMFVTSKPLIDFEGDSELLAHVSGKAAELGYQPFLRWPVGTSFESCEYIGTGDRE